MVVFTTWVVSARSADDCFLYTAMSAERFTWQPKLQTLFLTPCKPKSNPKPILLASFWAVQGQNACLELQSSFLWHEIRFVERGIFPIAKTTTTELFL